MLCRLLLGAIFILYLICVLILSGVQKEDLEVSLLKKLEHYNINIGNAINNVTVLEECLEPENVVPNSKGGVKKVTRKSKIGMLINLSTHTPVTLFQNNSDEKTTQSSITDIKLEAQQMKTVIEDATHISPAQVDKSQSESAQDILSLWETYAKPSSEDNENLSKLIDYGDSITYKPKTEIRVKNVTKVSYPTEKIPLKFTYDKKPKYNKKDIDDYISKQFQKYLPNKIKNKILIPKRKSIEFKLRKTRKQAKIVFKSTGLEESPFAKLDIVGLTNAVTKPPITNAVDNSHNLVLSDYIINKIAKSVKTMVIDDLRKELPMHYQLSSQTTVKCCPLDIAGSVPTTTECTTTKLQLSTTIHTSTLTPITPTTVTEYKAPNLRQPLKEEHLMALQKFLEIFGLQSVERSPTATTTEQNRMVYPYALPSQTPKYLQNLHELSEKFQHPYNPTGTNQNTQYINQLANNNKNKMVVTLQSNIGEIPPLRIPEQGARIIQNIIVSTKSPGGSHNERQRWWKARNLPISQFKIQAARYEPTSPYDSSSIETEFQSPAPIRMSKGKMWGPLNEQSYGYPSRPRPQDWRQNGYKIRYKNSKKAKFHEVLEHNLESTSSIIKANEDQEYLSPGRRPQQPINPKKTYNEAPFKKIMQTQQKVNDMLERILEMNNADTKYDIGTAS